MIQIITLRYVRIRVTSASAEVSALWLLGHWLMFVWHASDVVQSLKMTVRFGEKFCRQTANDTANLELSHWHIRNMLWWTILVHFASNVGCDWCTCNVVWQWSVSHFVLSLCRVLFSALLFIFYCIFISFLPLWRINVLCYYYYSATKAFNKKNVVRNNLKVG